MIKTFQSKEAAKAGVSTWDASEPTKDFAAAAIDGLAIPDGWTTVSVHIAESDIATLVHVMAVP